MIRPQKQSILAGREYIKVIGDGKLSLFVPFCPGTGWGQMTFFDYLNTHLIR